MTKTMMLAQMFVCVLFLLVKQNLCAFTQFWTLCLYGKLLRCPLLYGSVIHHLVQWCRIAVKSSFVALYMILLWNCPSTCNGCERPVRFFLYTMPLFSGCNADCLFFSSFLYFNFIWRKKSTILTDSQPLTIIGLWIGLYIYIYIYIYSRCLLWAIIFACSN